MRACDTRIEEVKQEIDNAFEKRNDIKVSYKRILHHDQGVEKGRKMDA